MQTEALMAKAEAEVGRLEGRVEILQARMKKVRVALTVVERRLQQARHERDVLARMIQRHGSDAARTDTGRRTEADVEHHSWADLTRLDAVYRALVEIGRPATLSEITAYLKDRGRTNDQVTLVSASLASLKARKRAENPDRGKWQIKRKEPAQTVHIGQLPGVLRFPEQKGEEAG